MYNLGLMPISLVCDLYKHKVINIAGHFLNSIYKGIDSYTNLTVLMVVEKCITLLLGPEPCWSLSSRSHIKRSIPGLMVEVSLFLA